MGKFHQRSADIKGKDGEKKDRAPPITFNPGAVLSYANKDHKRVVSCPSKRAELQTLPFHILAFDVR